MPAGLPDRLKAGGLVIVMRHAHTEPAVPGKVRTLDEQGRAEAAAFGETLRRFRIPIGRVYASNAERTYLTAELAGLRPVDRLGSLGHDRGPIAPQHIDALRQLIAAG
ncbi:MAG: histidine phosphatase family protein, partial [Proteobacteria bacterium]|nr:histidine phosphatase family protein [Pseudomonadota bacterium]